MADIEIVMEKLQGFETADDIAAYFMDYGIIAEPQNARACAISKFIQIETGMDDGEIATLGGIVKIDYLNEKGYPVKERARYEHTDAMVEFIKNYDKGNYPELIIDNFEFVPECNCENCK